MYTVLHDLKWNKFINVIDKAKTAYESSGQDPENHFPRVEILVEIGSGAKRDSGDLQILDLPVI